MMFYAVPICSVVVMDCPFCFLAIKALEFMLSTTQLWSAVAESGGRVARRFINECLFVRSRYKMLLQRVG